MQSIDLIETYAYGTSKSYGTTIICLGPKQMIQRLPIAIAQVKAVKTSENLLNEIRKIIYSLYRAKETSKKVCNNIMNWIKL